MPEITEIEVFKLYKGKRYAEMNDTFGAWKMTAPADYKPYAAYLKVLIDFFGAPETLFSDEKYKEFSSLIKGTDSKNFPDKIFFENLEKLKKLAPKADCEKFIAENSEFLQKAEELNAYYKGEPFERVVLLYRTGKGNFEYADELINRIEEVIGEIPLSLENTIKVAFNTNFTFNRDGDDLRKVSNVIFCKRLDGEIQKLEGMKDALFRLEDGAEQYSGVLKLLKSCEEKYLKAFITRKKQGGSSAEKLKNTEDKLNRLKTELSNAQREAAAAEKGLAVANAVPLKTGLFSSGANNRRQKLIDLYAAQIKSAAAKTAALERDIQKLAAEREELLTATAPLTAQTDGEKFYLDLLENLWNSIRAKKNFLEDYGATESTPDDLVLYQKGIELQILKKYGKTYEGYNKLNAAYQSMGQAGGLADYYLNKASLAKLATQLNEAREDLKELKVFFEL